MICSFTLVFLGFGGFIAWLFMHEEPGTENRARRIIGITACILFLIGATATIAINIQWEKHHNMAMYYVRYNPVRDSVEPVSVSGLHEDVWAIKEIDMFDKWTLEKCVLYSLADSSTHEDVVTKVRSKAKLYTWLKQHYAGNYKYRQEFLEDADR